VAGLRVPEGGNDPTMSMLITTLLFVLAVAFLVAVVEVVAGIVVLAVGAAVGVYLWNRYVRGSGPDTTITRT
jgi:predicted RND superfamily exporter protein